MKNIKIKRYRIIPFTLLAVGLSLMFTSCLKDKGPVQDFSESPALISFQYFGSSATPLTVGLLATPTDSFSLEITLSVASLTLSTPVTATIAADDAALANYNTDNGTSYVQLSSSLYSLQDNGTVTISPGQQIVNFTVHFAGDQIDFSKDNALVLTITDAQGAVIAANLNTAIILVKLKSVYEGSYVETGTLTRFNGATEASGVLDEFPIDGTTGFTTVNLTTIEGQIIIPGFAATYTQLTVNPDNTVTIAPSAISPSTDMQNIPGTTSTYDLPTKTFELHGQFLNSSGNLRQFDYTMTMQ